MVLVFLPDDIDGRCRLMVLSQVMLVLSFCLIALNFSTFYETAVTVGRNGFTCGSHALYVCQGCQAACLSRIGSTERRLVYSFAAVFIDLCPSIHRDDPDGVRSIV